MLPGSARYRPDARRCVGLNAGGRLWLGCLLVAKPRRRAHTFTEVEEFGGGIVPSLNELAHVPIVAPECQSLAPGDFIAPGQSVEEEIEEGEGEEKFSAVFTRGCA